MQLVVGINHTHWCPQIGCADCPAVVCSHPKGIGSLIYGHCIQYMSAVAEVQCLEDAIEAHNQCIFYHFHSSEINCTVGGVVGVTKYRPIPLHITLAVVADNGAALLGIATRSEHLSAFNRHMGGVGEGEAVVDIVLAVAEYLGRVALRYRRSRT